MQIVKPTTDEEIDLICALEDELLFLLMFWGEELSEEMSAEQKAMALDRSRRVLVCTGRKIAKTIIVEAKVIQYGLMRAKLEGKIAEALCFTPHVSQLTPLTNRIFGRVARTPLFSSMVRTILRGESPYMEWETGLAWYFRVEGIKGSDANMVGIRAERILGDEMAFGNEVCHSSRIQTALPGATWWYSGVPNGIRNSPFFRLDQTNDGASWSRHKYPTFINPLYQNEERRNELVEAYGGETTQGYKTQVLGEWGDELVSSFPPGSIAVGDQPYFVRTLTSSLERGEGAITLALGLPSLRAAKFCIGWDYGYSPDPSVLLIAYSNEPNVWLCYARIVMMQIDIALQCDIVSYLYKHVLLGEFVGLSCDHASAVQLLQSNDPARSELFYRVAPGGVMGMVDENGAPVFEKDSETGQPRQVRIRVKQYLTERLRQAMLNRNIGLEGISLALGNDPDMTEELAATRERKSDWYVVYYGPPDPNNQGRMMDHNTDAGRHLIDAILRIASASVRDRELDELIDAMGWAGEAQEWQASWTKAESIPGLTGGRGRL